LYQETVSKILNYPIKLRPISNAAFPFYKKSIANNRPAFSSAMPKSVLHNEGSGSEETTTASVEFPRAFMSGKGDFAETKTRISSLYLGDR